MEQLAVRQMPQARDPFVQGVVVLEVVTLQFPVPLSTEEVPRKVDLDVLFGAPVAEHHAATIRAEGVIDQRGGGRPVGTVERRLVQRRQNAVKRLPFAHRRAFACGRSVGSNTIGSASKNPPLFRIGSVATLDTAVAGAPLPAALTRAWRVRCPRVSAHPQHWGDLAVFGVPQELKVGQTKSEPARCPFRPQRRDPGAPSRDRPCLANMCSTCERIVLSQSAMAAMPQALTHRTASD